MKLLACENNPVMNEGSRKGGYAPAQWVLGRFPRRPGEIMDEDEFADLGVLSDRLDPQSAFQLQTKYRLACKKAFAEVDCSDRVARAAIRKAAPIPKEYAVGDLISFNESKELILLNISGALLRGLLDSMVIAQYGDCVRVYPCVWQLIKYDRVLLRRHWPIYICITTRYLDRTTIHPRMEFSKTNWISAILIRTRDQAGKIPSSLRPMRMTQTMILAWTSSKQGMSIPSRTTALKLFRLPRRTTRYWPMKRIVRNLYTRYHPLGGGIDRGVCRDAVPWHWTTFRPRSETGLVR